MMKTLFALILVMSCLIIGTPLFTRAQEKSQPELKLIEFHMALLKRGPGWTATETPDVKRLHSEHLAYVSSLLESGKAIIAGPLDDNGDFRGIYILRAKTADEAKAWAENDPAVKSGHLIAEMHPWWSEDVMKKPLSPIKLTTAYVAFLTRGAKWTAEHTAATEELQKAHLANVNRLAEMKKLVVAGPFGDKGNLRGIFVFKVASLDEAKALTATDPAVQAGRLAVDLHPWLVPDGILP
jgi:uncharacterized protein YciI